MAGWLNGLQLGAPQCNHSHKHRLSQQYNNLTSRFTSLLRYTYQSLAQQYNHSHKHRQSQQYNNLTLRACRRKNLTLFIHISNTTRFNRFNQ